MLKPLLGSLRSRVRPCRQALLTGVRAVTLGCSLAGCVTINLPPPPGPLVEHELDGTGSAKVLMLDLSGMISAQDGGGFLDNQPNLVARLKEELAKAAKDENVKALVIRINSPGGTVTASDILYHELRAFKEKYKVPVVASIMDVGASGGYYVAMAADKVLVHPSSVTGSIGVIMVTMDAKGLLDKVGLEARSITSGPKKDMGSPFRAMTDDERAIFQSVIDSFYERFLAVVKEGRPNLTADQIRKLADGRIYGGEQAKAAGLVDSVGYLEDAIDLAKRQANLSEARVVTYRRPGEYRPNIYAGLMAPPMNWQGLVANDLLGALRGKGPQFMYLWMP